MENNTTHHRVKVFSNNICMLHLPKIDNIGFAVENIDRKKISLYINKSCELFRFIFTPDRYNKKIYSANVGISINNITKLSTVSIRMYMNGITMHNNIDVLIPNGENMTLTQLVHKAYKILNEHIGKTRHIAEINLK